MPSVFFKLFKNAFSLIIASLVDKAAYVFFFAFIARKLNQADFGVFNLALTLILLGGILSSLGVEYVIIREVAKNREQSGLLLNNAILIILILTMLAWPFVTGLAFLLNYDSEVVFLVGFGGVVLIFIGLGQIASAIIKAYERMEIFSLIGALYSIIGLGFGVFALWRGGGVRSLVVALMITEGLKALTLSLIVHRYFTPIKLQFDREVFLTVFKQAIPFTLLMAYGILLRRTDILLMGWLRPLEEVAVYSAAAKFADFLSLFSGSMVMALFPALSAKLNSSPQESWLLYNDSIGIFSILGFGAALSIMVLAQPIITFLFGEAYINGATALSWLGWAFLFSVLSGPVGILLIAAGDQINRLLIMCVLILSSNILLNLWLIPIFSYNGAAMATFMSTVFGFIGRLILSRAYFGKLPKITGIVWRAFLAALLMGLLLKLLNGLNLFILIGLGGVAYGLSLSILGEFRQIRYKPIRLKLATIVKKLSSYRFTN